MSIKTSVLRLRKKNASFNDRRHFCFILCFLTSLLQGPDVISKPSMFTLFNPRCTFSLFFFFIFVVLSLLFTTFTSPRHPTTSIQNRRQGETGFKGVDINRWHSAAHTPTREGWFEGYTQDFHSEKRRSCHQSLPQTKLIRSKGPCRVSTRTWAVVDGVHFTHCGQLIKTVGMKWGGATLWPLQSGTVLSWDLKGTAVGVHEREGDACDTWKGRGIQ